MTQDELTVEVASEKHLIYVDEILKTIEDAAKVRGTGIAKRKPEYVAQKIKGRNSPDSATSRLGSTSST